MPVVPAKRPACWRPSRSEQWPNQFAWLQEKLKAFHPIFAPRIKSLNAADYQPPTMLADQNEVLIRVRSTKRRVPYDPILSTNPVRRESRTCPSETMAQTTGTRGHTGYWCLASRHVPYG